MAPVEGAPRSPRLSRLLDQVAHGRGELIDSLVAHGIRCCKDFVFGWDKHEVRSFGAGAAELWEAAETVALADSRGRAKGLLLTRLSEARPHPELPQTALSSSAAITIALQSSQGTIATAERSDGSDGFGLGRL